MTWVATGVTVAGTVYGAYQSNKAAGAAADSASQGNAMAQAQFDQLLKMLKPYRQAGKLGLGGQLNLLGLNGNDAQQLAINNLEKSPYFTSQVQQGENAILQNASATGGLRGGNTQAALAQFRPQMLAQAIENQYGKLAGLAAQGQNAAVNSGSAISGIAGLMNQQGQIGSQLAMAQGANMQNMLGGLSSAFGQYQGRQDMSQLINALNKNQGTF